MNPILVAGTRIVILALLSYTTAFLLEQRKRITNAALLFQIFGLLLDITATACMIIGSPNTPFTPHGFFGYTALAAMILKTFVILRFRVKKGTKGKMPRTLFIYAFSAYVWWVCAFLLGILLVVMK